MLDEYEQTAQQMRDDGAIVLRNFLSQNSAQQLREVVNSIYDLLNAAENIPDPVLANAFKAWHGVTLSSLPSFLAEASADLGNRYAQLRELIQTAVTRHLGEKWRFYPNRSFFRRHTGVAKKVPWHIDADAAHLLRENCINIWLPLDPVGIDSPSLDVIYGSHRAMRKIPKLSNDHRYRDDDFALKIGEPSTPQLLPGDALVFDQFILHRTQCVGSQQTIRTACEFRFYAPHWHDRFAVLGSRFVDVAGRARARTLGYARHVRTRA
jgi:ectoine hydroxylase-related dioxygenase (phytanoyl-CoA dioxygenase family)